MAENKMMRLSQVAKILKVATTTIVDHLSAEGFKVESSPNTKIDGEQIHVLAEDFDSDELRAILKPTGESPEPKASPAAESGDDDVVRYFREEPVARTPAPEPTPQPEPEAAKTENKLPGVKVIGKVELDSRGNVIPPKIHTPAPEPAPAPEEKTEEKPQPVAEVKEEEHPVEQKTEVAEEAPATQIPAATEEAIADEPPAPAAEEETAPEKVAAEAEPSGHAGEEAAEPAETPEVKPQAPEDEVIAARNKPLKGLTVVGKIELPAERSKKKEDASSDDNDRKRKRKRKRIRGEVKTENKPSTDVQSPQQSGQAAPGGGNRGGSNAPGSGGGDGNKFKGAAGGSRRREKREEVSQKEVSENIKATMARLSGSSARGASAKARRRRDRSGDDLDEHLDSGEDKLLRVTEFVSANELSSLMDVSVQEVISVCLNMGLFVSINQRLDAEAIAFIADEFGYEVQFISAEEEIEGDGEEEADDEADLVERAPIVTIMGHVDHGKTSLLDYIRKANVVSGEAGGITQHIGAYSVKTQTGKLVTFLDTPGHEAFTAMRARGAKITDVVIIVIAADDSIMPQTREAINHAQVAGVPIVFAFSKIDKPGANSDKIREELSQMNLLVEDWGGKYQAQEISSKTGLGIEDLLEKVLLEAELLELKANPKKRANGTVIEASLDKGRGYVTTLLVQNGTMRVGDIILAGAHFGRVKAMTDYRGNRLKEAGPSTPVQLLGLNGAPQAGDKFNITESEREAREIATKREQILREQSIRTRKHITLEEIGRRKAIGNFKQLNLIVKGDVDGSVEAISDSLLQQSTEEVQVNIIHKAVGQISESDVNLAIASDAIIVGFQVRPSPSAKKMAEQEQIEIRHYSVIYQAIEEIKDAILGMLAPTVEEVVTGNIEIREVFKISRIGTIAGCYVTDGFVKRNNKIRVVRAGIVIHTGEIDSLKRYKDDVQEVRAGYECGLNVKNFNDIEVGDIIESFEFKEVKRTL
ncbi:MAG: translation initiation factor IF-2 [Cytophagaceae bacterium SCN 52-12]|nr:MAG: translation initiation factor IF-2 [Cytophagaceae bacterium SCN 52-12]